MWITSELPVTRKESLFVSENFLHHNFPAGQGLRFLRLGMLSVSSFGARTLEVLLANKARHEQQRNKESTSPAGRRRRCSVVWNKPVVARTCEQHGEKSRQNRN